MNPVALFERLRQDFRLAVLTLQASIALGVLTPFGVFRLLNGQWLAAIMDGILVVAIFAALRYALVSGDSRRAGLFLVYFNSAGGIAASLMLGSAGAVWLYPLFLSNFILAHRKHAALSALIVLCVLLIDGRLFPTASYAVSFVGTALVTCALAFTFAYRAELHNEQLEQLAARDPLTGVLNRRNLQERLAEFQYAFSRSAVPPGLLMLDLDHFKRINDTWGHEAGDQVLVDFARIVQDSVRKTDLLFRFGGEEFVLLVMPASAEGLTVIANSLCQMVRDCLRTHGEAVTLSIGGAVLRPEESAEQWFARADAALYRAKEAGRDRVVMDV